MGRISGLVPSRFLTLLAHLVIVITIFWTRDNNIQASLPPHFTSEEYEKEDSKPRSCLGTAHLSQACWEM